MRYAQENAREMRHSFGAIIISDSISPAFGSSLEFFSVPGDKRPVMYFQGHLMASNRGHDPQLGYSSGISNPLSGQPSG